MKKEFYTGQRFREDEDCEDFLPVEFTEEGYAAIISKIKYNSQGNSLLQLTLYKQETVGSPLVFEYFVSKGSCINICHDHTVALTGALEVLEIKENYILLNWDF